MEKCKEEIILEYISNAYRRNSGILVVEDEEIIECIRDIVEKQIPKMVIETQELIQIDYICPECEYTNYNSKFNYCWNCGQRLDWQVSND